MNVERMSGPRSGVGIELVASNIVDASLQIHRTVGPGMLESSYEAMLEYELLDRGFHVERQKYVGLTYRGLYIERAYCIDLLVNKTVIVEIKSIEAIAPVHLKQVLTYLKMASLQLGILVNFGQHTLKAGGVHRLVNRYVPQ